MVAEVTLRRVASIYYPNSIAEVVWQDKQFSWTNAGILDFDVLTNSDWTVVEEVLSNDFFYTTTELHYARFDIDNYWTSKMTPTIRCGNHVFYDNGGKR